MDMQPGKNAVVTGAASGIGFGLAKKLAEEGMNLLLADINAEALARASGSLSAEGVRIETLRIDVADAADIKMLAEKARDVFTDTHLVCNNAGVINGANLWESTLDEYNWVMGVNLWGIIHSIREFVPILKSQACESHILNTVSMGALLNMPYNGIYHMSKAAALSLSESLYHELSLEAPHVGVTALCPEFVQTNLVQAEKNKPPHLQASDTPIREVLLATLAEHLNSEEAITPERLAERAVKAISEKRLFAIAEHDNPWTIAVMARYRSILDNGNPPFCIPTREGIAGISPE